jgi:hypothetical protein
MSIDEISLETVDNGSSHETSQVSQIEIFAHLGEAFSGTGRAQLTNAQKDGFSEPVAMAAGVSRDHIDIRSLNDEKQTRRAISESTFTRVQSDVEMLDWIFVGKCSGEKESYPKILSYMSGQVQILAGVSIFCGAKPNWHVIGVYYDPDNREIARIISKTLGYDFTKAIEVKIRDRRNLTKHLSDHDDPLTSDVFFTKEARAEIVSELMRKKSIAIQGPPGTGKTVIARSISLEVAGEEERVLPLQFHQSYSYEDFIRGWRPSAGGNLELTDGIFLKFCERAQKDEGNAYVVFIDEINRANISLVFGEVLSLIEATKRDKKFAVNLSYNHTKEADDKFYVPKNMFLVSTMNTADRSLALVDYALRRRFSFVDLNPAFGSPEFHDFVVTNGIDSAVVKEISTRMIALNDVIKEDSRNLGPGYQIGHSYFCGQVPPGTSFQSWYSNIVEHEIAPLLREYWADEGGLAEDRIGLLSSKLNVEEEAGDASV